MLRILEFLSRHRFLFTFLFLELIAVWAVVNRNAFQESSFHKLSLMFSARADAIRWEFKSKLNLEESNKELLETNARLQESLRKYSRPLDRTDLPPEILNRYFYLSGRVINQSTDRMKNFLTLNKGFAEGVQKDMGVISAQGVVGKITQMTSHFSTAQSILNPDFFISGQIRRNRILGSIKWDGENIYLVKFLFIPRHLEVLVGDTVSTSGFNAIFPPDVPIGYVTQVERDESDSYLDITVRLFHDFKRSDAVYIVGDRLRHEKDTLEKITFEESL